MNKHLGILSSILAAAEVVLLTSMANPVSAQQQYIISARAGLVNYTTGPVSFRTSNDSTWRAVPTQLQLEEGAHIKTEAWGKAELLLNPGSYLRIGDGAEVVVKNTDLLMTSFELRTGSAILEIGDLKDGVITLQTPLTRVRITKDGLYRIDVEPDATTLVVRKGEAFFQQAEGTFKKLKKNKETRITALDYEIAKISDDQRDEFDLWSSDRAETLLAANQVLIQRQMYSRGLGLTRSAWIYDSFFGCYTFFPWGYAYRSVYGYYYNPYFYPGGYWSGGYYPGGGGGSPRPTGPPSTTNRKSFSPIKKTARSVGTVGSPRSGRTVSSRSYRPSGGFSKIGAGRSYRGSIGGVSSGRIGGGIGAAGGAKIGGASAGGAKVGASRGGNH